MTTNARGEVLQFLRTRLASLQPEQPDLPPSGRSVAIGRFVAGLTDEAELRGDLAVLGYSDAQIARAIPEAQLRRQLDLFQDRLALWRAQVQSGQLTRADLIALLTATGLSTENIFIEVGRSEAQKPRQAPRRVTLALNVASTRGFLAPPQDLAPVALAITAAVARPATEVPRVRSVALALSVALQSKPPLATEPRPVQLALSVRIPGFSMAPAPTSRPVLLSIEFAPGPP